MSLALRELMRPLLAEFGEPVFTRGGLWGPALNNLSRTIGRRPTNFDIRETERNIIIEAETPGYRRENLSVEVEGDRLIIKGEAQRGSKNGDKSDAEPDFYERQSFTQAFQIPPELKNGQIDATYQDGILRINMNKPAPAEPKRVNIEIGSSSPSGIEAGDQSEQPQTIEVESKERTTKE